MDSATKIVAFVIESEDDDMKDLEAPSERMNGIHSGLLDTLGQLGINANQVVTRESDVYVMCRSHGEARQVQQAGNWKSMAEIAQTNPEHPDAKEFPWLVDIPFANLAGAIAKRTRRDFTP